jgi:hypothetical protein
MEDILQHGRNLMKFMNSVINDLSTGAGFLKIHSMSCSSLGKRERFLDVQQLVRKVALSAPAFAGRLSQWGTLSVSAATAKPGRQYL